MMVMQDRLWSNLDLDLSYNRLSGTLSSSFAAALANNTALQAFWRSLENNRFSGRIPTVVATIHNISVLTSNVFTCKLDRSDLPQHDDDVSNYQCGSSSFNAPFFIWFGSYLRGLFWQAIWLERWHPTFRTHLPPLPAYTSG